MKGSYGVLTIVVLLVIGIAIFVMFGPMLGEISLIIIEALIVIAIVFLLVRYFRSRT